MKKQKVNIKRITEFIKPEWFFMTISIINGLFYVIFNAISIWLTASLVNNVLIDFDKLVQNQKQLLANTSPSINEKIKILVNEFILRDTNIETLRVLCFSIVLIFILKNIFLYLKNLSMSFVQLRIVTQLRNRIYAHLQSLSLSFFYKRRSGDLSSIIIHDVSMISQSIGTTFQKIIVNQ
jgi:ABC-type multidrug transport system, ATPase and permease components